MRHHSIDTVRQLRLTLQESPVIWPEEIWDSVPEEARREVLARLAQLLERWINSKRQL